MTTKRKAERNLSFHHLCEETGKHEWISTTAPGFEKCNRWKCRAARCWNGSTWIDQDEPAPQADLPLPNTARHVEPVVHCFPLFD